MSTEPTVCIIESLGFLEEKTHREGEIISRTLQLSEKDSAYINIRNVEELRAVVSEFSESSHRYLHLSCHGLRDGKKLVGFALTTGSITTDELARLLAPHIRGRRVFLSSCLAARGHFAETLMRNSGCRSVLAPVNRIGFDDAAVFWAAFYHLMFKAKSNSMTTRRIAEKVEICAALVNEQFRLFSRDGLKGKLQIVTIGPKKKRKSKA